MRTWLGTVETRSSLMHSRVCWPCHRHHRIVSFSSSIPQQLQRGIAPGLRPEAVKTCENHCMNSHQAHGADSATTSATVLDRLSPRGRLVGLDVARGIALLAMMVTHIFALGDETGMPTWAAAFAGRASALFAVLAGCSLVLSTRSRLAESGRL